MSLRDFLISFLCCSNSAHATGFTNSGKTNFAFFSFDELSLSLDRELSMYPLSVIPMCAVVPVDEKTTEFFCVSSLPSECAYLLESSVSLFVPWLCRGCAVVP